MLFMPSGMPLALEITSMHFQLSKERAYYGAKLKTIVEMLKKKSERRTRRLVLSRFWKLCRIHWLD